MDTHATSRREADEIKDAGPTVVKHSATVPIQYPTGLKLVIIMTSLMLGTTLMALDTTIISIATPNISTQFQSLDDVRWLGAAYLMTLTAFTPVASNFYKNFNPKYVYLAFIAVFEVGSAICASAPNSPAFITGRAIAGLGAAGLLQGAFGILTYVCTLEQRPLFLGLVVSLFGLFSSIGPLVGGALTECVTWRNLPIGGAVVILVILFLTLHGVDQSTRQVSLWTKLRRLDLPGIVLLLASVSCLFLALQEGGIKVPWSSSKPVGLLVGFGLLMILFAAWQVKARENATIPVRCLKNRTVLWGSIYLLFDNMANYIPIYYVPFYFQAGLGHSPLKSAVDYISLAVPQMIGLLAGGGITTATGHYVRLSPCPIILVDSPADDDAVDASHSGCSSLMRYRLRTLDNSPIRHSNSFMGRISGLDWPWARLGGQRAPYCNTGCDANVSQGRKQYRIIPPIYTPVDSDNDVFIANGISQFPKIGRSYIAKANIGIASFFGQIGG
ncbi:MAG: hypothetical protein Q9170_005009 [Blastenia crenularia]